MKITNNKHLTRVNLLIFDIWKLFNSYFLYESRVEIIPNKEVTERFPFRIKGKSQWVRLLAHIEDSSWALVANERQL